MMSLALLTFCVCLCLCLCLCVQPLMFWHLANALQQEYWMLPVPYSFWLQEKMTVPLNDVKQILLISLDAGKEGVCPDGFTLVGSNCMPCPEGTYRWGARTRPL